ncbi:hypothetical protein HA402_001934 [Bradysia odoriphaga]|nr:hypothetical protein HA402_001934 [Bradysia odoriphaga]
MHSPRSNFGAEIMDDAILVFGGYDGHSIVDKVEYYRAEENKCDTFSTDDVIIQHFTAHN